MNNFDKAKTMHIPVMSKEVISAMNVKDGGLYLDCTFGGGGHTSQLLQAANCKVLSIDKDMNAIERGAPLIERYGNDRLKLVHVCFSDLKDLVQQENTFQSQNTPQHAIGMFDGILMDLGISSDQLADQYRGFSFMTDGNLDMRMNHNKGISAYDVVNSFKEKELADLIFEYGEERASRRIAKAIVDNRPIKTAKELGELCRSCIKGSGKIHPATKVFQALRIFVNDEMDVLEKGLYQAIDLLKVGGRLVVISFHSLEDRLVKYVIKNNREYLTVDKEQALMSPQDIEKKKIQERARHLCGLQRGYDLFGCVNDAI